MKKHKKTYHLQIGFALIIGILLGGSATFFIPYFSLGKYTSRQLSTYEKFSVIDQILQKEFYDQEQLSGAKEGMMEGAIKGYVNGLQDPHTNYLSTEENTLFMEELNNNANIEGIGAVIEKKEDYIQIQEVIKNGPAYEAGLQPLDRIIMIGTGGTQTLTTSEAVQKIRGEKGTSVRLGIWRITKEGEDDIFEIEVVRDTISIPSVRSRMIDYQGKKLGYIELSLISDNTTKLLLQEINALYAEGMEGILLDLRGNSGGFLEEAVKILGHFVPQGELVVKSAYYAFDSVEHYSKGRGELAEVPMVILVDLLTASAGEIIALTLQERGVSVVGTQTFGKGSIQTYEEFPDGSNIKYTIGKRFSPRGVNIDGVGMTPNEIVERDQDAYANSGIDKQLEKAEELLVSILK
ncbi:MAG: S41 family peptidase [Candidatus Absconditabacteria bacterium]|nr:S41 family peptidase [Candidatus Absconditabacteria bacterium]MDD3868606.1 S41 family peptidase [Candidatus Absconditabacteria bacterium]MDD4714725.1 S41 family peptidase [Candidatus Absconditabacteria bacterium]